MMRIRRGANWDDACRWSRAEKQETPILRADGSWKINNEVLAHRKKEVLHHLLQDTSHPRTKKRTVSPREVLLYAEE